MNRLLLSYLNAPFLMVLAMVAVALQGALFSFYPLDLFRPDFILFAVIWCAHRRNFIEGGILTLIFAEIAEIHSGSPRGYFAIVYMSAYLILYALTKYLMFSNRRSLVTLSAWSSVGTKLIGLIFLRVLGIADRQWENTLTYLLPGAMAQAALALVIFPALEKFDILTFKDPKVRERLQDELHLDEEGL